MLGCIQSEERRTLQIPEKEVMKQDALPGTVGNLSHPNRYTEEKQTIHGYGKSTKPQCEKDGPQYTPLLMFTGIM